MAVASYLFVVKHLVASTRLNTKSLFSDLAEKMLSKEYLLAEEAFKKIPHTFCMTLPDDGEYIRSPDMKASLNIPGNYTTIKETSEGELSFLLDIGNIKWKDQPYSWNADLIRENKAIFIRANIDNKTFYRSKLDLPPGYESYSFRTKTIDGGLLVTLYNKDGEARRFENASNLIPNDGFH